MSVASARQRSSGFFSSIRKWMRRLPLPIYLAAMYGLGYLTLVGDIFKVLAVAISVPESSQELLKSAYVAFAVTHVILTAALLIIRRTSRREPTGVLAIWMRVNGNILFAALIAIGVFIAEAVRAPDIRAVRSAEVARTAQIHRLEIEDEIGRGLQQKARALRQRIDDLFPGPSSGVGAAQFLEEFHSFKDRIRASGQLRRDFFVLSDRDRVETIPELGEPAPEFVSSMIARPADAGDVWLQQTDMGPMIVVSMERDGHRLFGGELWTKFDFLEVVFDVADTRGFDVTIGDSYSGTTVYSTDVSPYGMSLDGTLARELPLESPIEVSAAGGSRYVYRWEFDDKNMFPTLYLEVSFDELAMPSFRWYSLLALFGLFLSVILFVAFGHEHDHESS